jgi:Tfp pilus assembly protein PilO
MKPGEPLLAFMVIAAIAIIPIDVFYTSRFIPRFKTLETQRIVTSNQLATAKIVSENLNHVRELVFQNMEFAGQEDTLSQETILFDFLTECVNDLKMKLVSVRPLPPTSQGRVTTYGYDLQLEGDFFSFGEFCSKLENSRRVLALTSFELSQISRGSGSTVSVKDPKEQPRIGGSNNKVSIKLHLDTFRVKKGA